MLNIASATAGITLSAVFLIFIFVTSKFVGWKSFVPLSNLISFISWSICMSAVEGLFALDAQDQYHDFDMY